MEMGKVSAMILAGGYSSRMGSDKASLILCGRSLIELQTEKLRSIGIGEILLSGYAGELEGTVHVPDVYPHRGPLSGVHACLNRASGDACLAISVDVPLLPAEVLKNLIEHHNGGITVLVHGEKVEPLMAVYDCGLASAAEEILQSERTAMMKLFDRAEVTRVEYTGDPDRIANCNTPEEFSRITALAEERLRSGQPLY